MKADTYEVTSDAALAALFEEQARVWGNAVLDGDVRKAGRAVHKLGEIGDAFKARNREARLLLLPLLGDPERGVRYYAARYLLGVTPEKALPVLKQLALGMSSIAVNASITIERFESGEYKP